MALGRIQHHEDQIRRPRHGNDLFTAPLALRGALNDTGQVKQLDAGAVVFDLAGDTSQGRELVAKASGVTQRLKTILYHRFAQSFWSNRVTWPPQTQSW
ncbi:hypothetical protein BC936DRAFT_145091 [Jimgerdemannia flammicorona]|uniref:Uncharacterized protein n=2 Tax=Jimgerdemannia flammicorona TaxID=994334 RepID=A0A433DAZ6_9FUNG|nr:hypothetical protein BC936DRAFT_145091 [Jimgerdemannia flammicorona]RUS27164.1 hypothetical protein BC938DRAFT_483640 [Jimgerdemannia flammicorona]